jgi:hypothetical protein
LLAVSVIVLWVIVLVLSVLVVLLYRQFGLLYLGSGGRVRVQGLVVGERFANTPPVFVDGHAETIDWTAAGEGRGTLVLLTHVTCPLTESILPTLNAWSFLWDMVDIWVVDRKFADSEQRIVPTERQWTYATSPDGSFHRALDIDVSPYAYLFDINGVVQARDIVGDAQGLTQLLESALRIDGQFRTSTATIPIRAERLAK